MNKAVEIKKFESQVKAYEETIAKLVGNKYGITADEFAMSVMTAVKRHLSYLTVTEVRYLRLSFYQRS